MQIQNSKPEAHTAIHFQVLIAGVAQRYSNDTASLACYMHSEHWHYKSLAL